MQNIFPDTDANTLLGITNAMNKYASYFDLDKEKEICHLISQTGYESGYYKELDEKYNLEEKAASIDEMIRVFPQFFKKTPEYEGPYNPADYLNNAEKLANLVYDDDIRKDLKKPKSGIGNEDEGDGWKYRGRGTIHLTGEDNYEAFNIFIQNNSNKLGIESPVDVLRTPNIVAENLDYAVLAGMWFLVIRERLDLEQLSVLDVTKEVKGDKKLIKKSRTVKDRDYYYKKSGCN